MINIDPAYIEMRKFAAAWVHIKPSQEHVYKFNRNLPYTGMRLSVAAEVHMKPSQ